MRLYHLALVEDWSRAVELGYEASTLGVALDQQGFIHCSFADQVEQVADVVYRGRDDVVLLEIDAERLHAPVKVEGVDDGERFPHVYGALNRDAVVRATRLRRLPDGRLDVSRVLHGG